MLKRFKLLTDELGHYPKLYVRLCFTKNNNNIETKYIPKSIVIDNVTKDNIKKTISFIFNKTDSRLYKNYNLKFITVKFIERDSLTFYS